MQIKLKTYVQNLINKNNKSGSILFHGINNGPKFSIAQYTIQMLNCHKLKNQEPCGTCISCEKIKAFNHPDLHIVLPMSSDKKTENKALEIWKKHIKKNNQMNLVEWKRIIALELGIEKEPVISSEKINQLKSILKLKNFEAKKRVVLIWHAEALNIVSSNKLLKMLEEPPDETYFIFVTDDVDGLIGTIKSRLERVHVKEEIEKNHLKQITTNTELENCSNFINHNELLEKNFNKFKTWMRACHAKNVISIYDLNLELSRDKKNGHNNFLQYCLEKLSFCCRHKAKQYYVKNKSEELMFINNFCKHLNLEKMLLILEKTQKSLYLLKRKANSKILFFSLSIDLFWIFDENKV